MNLFETKNKKFNTDMKRRKFLKVTAAATGAMSLNTLMVQKALAANPGAKRVIFWYVPEGCVQQAFWPKDLGEININMNASVNGVQLKSDGSKSIHQYMNNNTASYCLQHLERHKTDFSMYSGFKNYGVTDHDAHHGSVRAALTGGGMHKDNVEAGKNESIDQFIGRRTKEDANGNAITGAPPLSSIYIPVYGQHAKNIPVANGYVSPVRDKNGQYLGSPNWNPMEVYNTVFPNDVPAPTGTPDGKVPYGAQQQKIALMNSMESRLEEVRCLGGDEASKKYEALYHSFQKIETETTALFESAQQDALGGGPDLRFDIPNGWKNTQGDIKDLKYYWNQEKNFPKLMDIAIDTAVAALAFGKTNVATLHFSGTGNDDKSDMHDHYKFIGSGVENNGDVHITDLEPGDVNDHYLSHDGNPETYRNQARIFRWYYGKLAYLIDALKAIPDGAGETLFDNTLIVTCSEFSQRDHRNNDMPYILAGGLQDTLKTGQFIDARLPNGDFRDHGEFLLGITEAMGTPKPKAGETTAVYRGMFK